MVVDTSFEYQLQDEDILHRGIAKNLSGKGMMFIAENALTPGTQIKVELAPTNKITPPLQALMRVSRCQPQDDGSFQVACEMISID